MRPPEVASLEGEGWERGARLKLGADEDAYAAAVVGLIKREGRAWFAPRLERHCGVLGVETPNFALGDARTRWGSCMPAQGRQAPSIRLSWRLALAPPTVADYVAAHECAHLLELNHGPRFWAHVRGLVGDPAAKVRAEPAAQADRQRRAQRKRSQALQARDTAVCNSHRTTPWKPTGRPAWPITSRSAGCYDSRWCSRHVKCPFGLHLRLG